MGKSRTKKSFPTRGFEARYGSSVRKRYIEAISGLKTAHKCPQCYTKAVQRKSVGLWKCRKCGAIFTGGAYVPTSKLGIVAKRTAKGSSIENLATVKENE
jgi:large subunit ribosomal protein L37Ae